MADQRDTRFNWATRSRAWKHAGLTFVQPVQGLLQLGHALSRVETYKLLSLLVHQGCASIGPRALARGNMSLTPSTRSTKPSFNWATRSRAWKRAIKVAVVCGRIPLQLGHALSRVETDRCGELFEFVDGASIGPRALARGNERKRKAV